MTTMLLRFAPVRETAEFVDEEHGCMRIGRQRRRQFSGAKRGREVINECGGSAPPSA
jgi:hypothetical protein